MTSLRLEIDEFVPAAPSRVFAAWTTEDQLLQWWGPPGGSCTAASIDLRVGGKYRLRNKLPDGSELEIWGEFVTIDAPHHLEYTWSTQLGRQPLEHVAVHFTAERNGTRVWVSHHQIETAEILTSHEAGWRSCLKRLHKAL